MAQRDFQRSTRKNLDMEQMSDIILPVQMVLARKEVTVRDLLRLQEGMTIVLDRLAGENIDLYVNKRHIAKGEVVVTNQRFGFRVVTLLSPEERLKQM